MDQAHKRFKEVRETLGYTQKEFAEKLHLKGSTADLERGRIKIPGPTLMELMKEFKINPLWIYGQSKKQYVEEHDGSPKVVSVDADERENILMVNVKAAAGYAHNISEPSYYKKLPAFSMPLPQYRNASFRAFQVKGDSMQPLLQSKDWVIAEALEHIDHIKDGEIYIVVEEDGVRVKKVEQRADQLLLISLNTEYAPDLIPKKNVVEVWKFHSHLRFGAEHPQPNLGDVLFEIHQLRDEVKKLKLKN